MILFSLEWEGHGLCFSGTGFVCVEAVFVHGYESVRWSSCATEARVEPKPRFSPSTSVLRSPYYSTSAPSSYSSTTDAL
jgi:hypothetical protein